MMLVHPSAIPVLEVIKCLRPQAYCKQIYHSLLQSGQPEKGLNAHGSSSETVSTVMTEVPQVCLGH